MSAATRIVSVGAALAWCLVSASALAQAPAATTRAASDLPTYQRVDTKLTGTIKAVGSSTVAAMLKQVTDAFEAEQPGVTVDIGGSGSGTALAGMLESPTTMGLLSRPMTQRERDAFKAKYGHEPTEIKMAVDAVGIFVFKNNPMQAITLADLRRAYGRDANAADNWGALLPPAVGNVTMPVAPASTATAALNKLKRLPPFPSPATGSSAAAALMSCFATWCWRAATLQVTCKSSPCPPAWCKA